MRLELKIIFLLVIQNTCVCFSQEVTNINIVKELDKFEPVECSDSIIDFDYITLKTNDSILIDATSPWISTCAVWMRQRASTG